MHEFVRKAVHDGGAPYREVIHAHLPQPVKGPADVAAALAIPLEQIAKTLLLYAGQPCFAVLPANKRLQFDVISQAMGSRCRAATSEELQQWIPYPAGAVSPLGISHIRVFVECALRQHEHVLVGGGERGTEVELRVADLVALTQASELSLS